MKKIALFTFLTLLLCTSCVTKKKFMMTEAARIDKYRQLAKLLTDAATRRPAVSTNQEAPAVDTTPDGKQYPSVSEHA